MLRTLTSLDGVLEYGTLTYDKIRGVFTIHVNLFSSMLSYQYDQKIFTSVSYLAEWHVFHLFTCRMRAVSYNIVRKALKEFLLKGE